MTNPTDEPVADAASARPERPIRLDGAFPRVDADDWRVAAEASSEGGTGGLGPGAEGVLIGQLTPQGAGGCPSELVN